MGRHLLGVEGDVMVVLDHHRAEAGFDQGIGVGQGGRAHRRQIAPPAGAPRQGLQMDHADGAAGRRGQKVVAVPHGAEV